jgi:hypothetical protein
MQDGTTHVLEQVRGLPIGGHFSAALVELVALWKELTEPWPAALANNPTARYRDNFFVGFPVAPDPEELQQLADGLTRLLRMPVKWENAGDTIRVLELRVSVRPGMPPRAVLAFRTDADRQGESHDVTSWPHRDDPRTPLVLPALLHGLAAKIRQYHVPGAGGYTATVRRSVTFLRGRGYPTSWWMRPFTMALLRCGVAVACMPRVLRGAAWDCAPRLRAGPEQTRRG